MSLKWTDYARVIDVQTHPKRLIAATSLEGTHKGKTFVFGHSALNITDGILKKKLLMEIDEEAEWINAIHPGKTTIDAVSLSMIKMLGYERIEALKRTWLNTKIMDGRTITPVFEEDGKKPSNEIIVYSGRRYHWEGKNKGINFQMNAVSFEGKTPLSIIEALKFKPLREVIDHPGITKKAITTGGWTSDESTTISYDVEDVDMEEVFGDVSRLGLEKMIK